MPDQRPDHTTQTKLETFAQARFARGIEERVSSHWLRCEYSGGDPGAEILDGISSGWLRQLLEQIPEAVPGQAAQVQCVDDQIEGPARDGSSPIHSAGLSLADASEPGANEMGAILAGNRCWHGIDIAADADPVPQLTRLHASAG